MTVTTLPLAQVQQLGSFNDVALRAWLASQFPNLSIGPPIATATLLLAPDVFYAPSNDGTDYYFYQVVFVQIPTVTQIVTCIVQIAMRGSTNAISYVMLQQGSVPLNGSGLQLQ